LVSLSTRGWGICLRAGDRSVDCPVTFIIINKLMVFVNRIRFSFENVADEIFNAKKLAIAYLVR
jgi:hypothetical protein